MEVGSPILPSGSKFQTQRALAVVAMLRQSRIPACWQIPRLRLDAARASPRFRSPYFFLPAPRCVSRQSCFFAGLRHAEVATATQAWGFFLKLNASPPTCPQKLLRRRDPLRRRERKTWREIFMTRELS